MTRRLTEIPLDRNTVTYLRVVIGALLCLQILGSRLGFLGPVNGWIEVHIFLWGAIADVIIVSLFLIVIPQLPRGSEAYYLAFVVCTPFFLIIEPCGRKAPHYIGSVFLISLLYFLIRQIFFYDSSPSLKTPERDGWERLDNEQIDDTMPPLLGDKDDRKQKIVMAIFIAAIFLMKYLDYSDSITYVPLWWAITDILVLCIGGVVMVRSGMKSPIIVFIVMSMAMPTLRPSLQVLLGHPIGVWMSLGVIIFYFAVVILVRRFFIARKDGGQNFTGTK